MNWPVEVLPGTDELVVRITTGSAGLYIIGVESFPETLSALEQSVGLFSNLVNPNQFLFLGNSELAELKTLLESPVFGGYLVRGGDGANSMIAERMAGLCGGLVRPKAWGGQGFLRGPGKVQTVRLARSIQKQEAVEAVRRYLEALKYPARVSSFVANAVDELLMNAIFDAPTNALGQQIHAKTPRSADFPLEGRGAVEMHVASNEHSLAVTVVDLYGSVDKVRLLTHMARQYSKHEYKIRTATTSAGLGLGTILNIGAGLCFVCDRGNRTEATVFFQKASNFREFRKQFRFLVTQFYSE